MAFQTTTAPLPRRGHRWFTIGAATLAVAAIAVALALSVGAGSKAPAPASSTRQAVQTSPSIMTLTPAELASGALGSGYALPSAQTGPTTESVLASMSPSTRRYTEAITSLTFAQLAAGAAGAP